MDTTLLTNLRDIGGRLIYLKQIETLQEFRTEEDLEIEQSIQDIIERIMEIIGEMELLDAKELQ